MAVVSQREGVRIVAFNKCGHTSITNMFLTAPGKDVVRGAKPAVLLSGPDYPPPEEVYKGTTDDALTWPEPEHTLAFFRNPVARATSAYQHFIVRTLKYPLTGMPSLGRAKFTMLGFEAGMTFTDFCKHLQKIDLTFDAHLKPQALSYNKVVAGKPWTGRLEYLSTLWPEVVDMLQLPCTKNVVDFNAASYDDCATQEDVAILLDLYNDDFELWSEASYHEARAPLSTVDNQAP